jgi:protein-tyrosine phosphatase
MADISSLITEIPFGFPGKIFRSPMPFSSYDGLGKIWTEYRENGIDLVVLLTESHEYLTQTGRDLPDFYRSEGLDVIQYPIEDFGVPPIKKGFDDAIKMVINRAKTGENIAVHCLGGSGRTGIFLACLAKRHFSFEGQESIIWLRQYVKDAIENHKQETFVLEYNNFK